MCLKGYIKPHIKYLNSGIKTLIITLTVLVSITAQAQVKPPKNTSKVVQVMDSNAFNTCYKFLIEKGYTIDQADRDLGLIKTAMSDRFQITVNILDTIAYFSASFEFVAPYSGSTSIMKACWCGLAGDYRRRYFKRLLAMFEGVEYTFR